MTRSSACGCGAQRVTRPGTQSVRTATRLRGRPRYGRGRLATRRLVHHDMAGPARSVHAAWAKGVHLT